MKVKVLFRYYNLIFIKCSETTLHCFRQLDLYYAIVFNLYIIASPRILPTMMGLAKGYLEEIALSDKVASCCTRVMLYNSS